MSETKSMRAAKDVVAQIKTRAPLLWVVTPEEERAERYLRSAALAANYKFRTWDTAVGISTSAGEPDPESPETEDAMAAFAAIRSCQESRLWVMRDLPVWLGSGAPFARTVRTLRNMVRELPTASTPHTLCVLSPSGEVPIELRNHATVIEWPLPDRAEIGEILEAAMEPYADDDRVEKLNGNREAAIDAAVGLTEDEALACFGVSLVQEKRINPIIVANEKKRVIARERILEWYDPLPGGLDSVGGLEVLKKWLTARVAAFSPGARAYGLPTPKGILIVGIPGTGKSLTAKAVATAWGCPLIRFDLGALKSKFVGESEANIRRALKVIEALGRCVVWLDEIEKALQGATSGSSDGGTSTDQLGTLLSWMQERSSEAFVIATANDVTALPPELMRKGRFDEVFFVDLPNDDERLSILKAALKTNRQEIKLTPELAKVAVASCNDFTGSEIAAIVPEAMFTAFNDGARKITAADLTAAAADVVPLARTAAPKIAALREWAKGKARSASAPRPVATEKRVRALDLKS